MSRFHNPRSNFPVPPRSSERLMDQPLRRFDHLMPNEHEQQQRRFQDVNVQGSFGLQTKPPPSLMSSPQVLDLLWNNTLQTEQHTNSPSNRGNRGRGRGINQRGRGINQHGRGQLTRVMPLRNVQTRGTILSNTPPRNTVQRGTPNRNTVQSGTPNRNTVPARNTVLRGTPTRGTPNRTSFDRRQSLEEQRGSIENRRKSNEIRRNSNEIRQNSNDIRRNSAGSSTTVSKRRTDQYPEDAKEKPLTDMEKEAMSFDLPQTFFERIKPLTMTQVAHDAALDYIRKELDKKRGGNTPLVNLRFKEGNYACRMCRQNFKIADDRYDHNKSFEHKEMEHLCKVRKEQARLILARKITKLSKNFKETPTEEEKPAKVSTSIPSKDMVLILKAEKEMNLKPTMLELDPYILGIYESVMRDYWPNPRSELYCRVCNYQEFKTVTDFEEHKKTLNHIDRENCYDDAFCLYCQIHSGNAASMRSHELSIEHEEIKNLMERSKQTAIEHWHQVNKFELPEQFRKHDEHEKEQQIGSKRSAPDPPETSDQSPTKKQNLESSHSTPLPPPPTPPAVKSQAAKTIENLFLKNNSQRRTSTESKAKDTIASESSDSDRRPEFTPQVNLRRIPRLHDQPLLPREKVWFVPVTAVMCVACQTFVEEKKQKAHCKEILHNTNVIKFKRQINM